MCGLFKTPTINTATTTVSKADTTSAADTAAEQIEKQKKRQGFQSTVATGGQGVTGQANTLKTTLGS